MQRLVDGPFPAWMITASIAAMILTTAALITDIPEKEKPAPAKDSKKESKKESKKPS